MGYAAAINNNVAARNAIGLKTHVNRYDDNGKLTYQRVLKSDNYDAAGHLAQGTGVNLISVQNKRALQHSVPESNLFTQEATALFRALSIKPARYPSE